MAVLVSRGSGASYTKGSFRGVGTKWLRVLTVNLGSLKIMTQKKLSKPRVCRVCKETLVTTAAEIKKHAGACGGKPDDSK